MTPPAPAIDYLRTGQADMVRGQFLAMDESAGDDGEQISLGLLVSTQDLGTTVHHAMTKMRRLVAEEPDSIASARARKTLDRGWFHASKDASLARECLADALSMAGPLDFHVTHTENVGKNSRKSLFKAFSINALSLASLIDRPSLEILVPKGPISETQEGLDELFEQGAAGLIQLHREPPKLDDPRKQKLLDAALSTEANYGTFRAKLCDADHSLVQSADLLLWLFGPGKGTQEKAVLQRKFHPRKARPFGHNGVSAQWWKLGR